MVHARSLHPNAPLAVEGRRRMVACVLDLGWTVEATAQRFQVDAKTVRKWRDRLVAEGDSGCVIGPSRARLRKHDDHPQSQLEALVELASLGALGAASPEAGDVSPARS